MNALDRLLREGVERRVYGAARALVLHRGQTAWSGGTVPAEAVFDLASVTKVLSTTALCCRFFAEGRLRPDETLGAHLPGAAAADVTLADLLFHRSGLPPFLCYFADELLACPALFDDAPHATLRDEVRRKVLARAAATAPTQPPRRAAVYSDIGFMLLGAVLERAGGARQDELFARHVAGPLRLERAGYRPLSARLPLPDLLLPTGATRPREPAPGQEGLWSVPLHPSRLGEVDDDNAWVMAGVAGHAGLFASAPDVARFGQAVLEGWLSPPVPLRADATTPGSTRTLGFDTPSQEGSSAGGRLGNLPPGAVGHLGFTGTSLWIDLGRELVVVLLTNRTIFGRANLQLRDFRPRFHDAVLDALKL